MKEFQRATPGSGHLYDLLTGEVDPSLYKSFLFHVLSKIHNWRRAGTQK